MGKNAHSKGVRAVLFSMALCLGFLGMAPAAQAQSDGVKTLDQMMNEVDDEIDESDAGSAPDGGTGEEGSKRVKSLDELMGEVDEEAGVDVPEETKGAESQDDRQATAKPVSAAAEKPETTSDAAPEETDGSGWFVIGLVGLLIFLILAGVPLYVLIGSIAGYLLLAGGIFEEFGRLTIIIEETRGLADEPVLLAIPFFVVSGAIMTEGDIARRLIDVAEALFGELPGGLAISTVFACAIFAAISGSSPVTVIAIGTIMYPVLVESGYPDQFSCGLVTSAGSLGILIPPSIPMIVYGIVDPTGLRDPAGYTVGGAGGGDLGVGDLFIAGVVPGTLIGVVLSCYALYIGAKEDVETTDFDWRRLWDALRRGIWALFLPILILGGIYTGVFTPTQAAAVSVIYAVVVEFFIHRSVEIDDMPSVLTESAVLMGSILIIMALALGFNLYLNRAKIPEAAVDLIVSWDLSIIGFLLILNVLLLVVGFFMDILSAILILVPLLAPIGFQLGIHPVHLAIIFIVNLEIGYLTPPIGINLFVAGALFEKGLADVIKSVLPFLGLMLSCLLVVTYVPSVSLGLVSVSNGGSFVVGFPDGPVAAEKQEEQASEKTPKDEAKPKKPKAKKPKKKGVKSLDQLMNEVDDESGGDAPADKKPKEDVKSLDQLMNEVDEDMKSK